MLYEKSFFRMLSITAATVIVLLTTVSVMAEEGEEVVWDEPEAKAELTEERVNWIIERIAEQNPEHARELMELRKNNPRPFRKEIQELAKEHFGRRMRQHQPMGPGQGRGGGFGMPGRGPGREMEGHMPPPMMPRMGQPPEGGRGLGGGRGMRQGMGGGRMRGQFETQQEFIEWLKENYPEEAEELEELHERNPEAAVRRLALSRRQYGRIMEAHQENPALAEVLKEDLQLKQHRDEILEQIKSAKGDNRDKLRKELHEVVSARFDLIVRKKQLKYEELLRRLERLQKEVQEREAEVEKLAEKKDSAVQERLGELVGKREKINWE